MDIGSHIINPNLSEDANIALTIILLQIGYVIKIYDRSEVHVDFEKMLAIIAELAESAEEDEALQTEAVFDPTLFEKWITLPAYRNEAFTDTPDPLTFQVMTNVTKSSITPDDLVTFRSPELVAQLSLSLESIFAINFDD